MLAAPHAAATTGERLVVRFEHSRRTLRWRLNLRVMRRLLLGQATKDPALFHQLRSPEIG